MEKLDKRSTQHRIKPNHFGKAQIGNEKPRLGNYEDIIGMSPKDSNRIFDNSFAVDLESTGLAATKNSIVQAAFKKGNNYNSFFIQQKNGFSLQKDAPFLAKSGFANAVKGIDFTKLGKIEGYESTLKSLDSTFSGKVVAERIKAEQLADQLEKFVLDARTSGKPIFIQNPNFEIRQFEALFASLGRKNPLQLSQEYIEIRSNHAIAQKSVFKDLNSKRISSTEAFDKLFEAQKTRFIGAMSEAKKAGAIVDVQDIGRMLNAVSQQKGLQLKTGRFGANTNIDHLANIFIGLGEAHESSLDLNQQDILAKRMFTTVQELVSGKAESPWTHAFIKSNKVNAVKFYEDNLKKTILSEIEAGNNPFTLKHMDELPIEGIDRNSVFERIIKDKEVVEKASSMRMKSNTSINVPTDSFKKVKGGSLLFGSIMLGTAAMNLFKFSGSDDQANTIEGLGHEGVAGQNRQQNTSFGSGFRTEKFNQAPQGQEEQEGVTWKQLGLTGLGATGAYAVFKAQADKKRLNDITYLGKLDANKDNETLLGRKNTTVQDATVAGLRRLENTFGGFGKAFGAADVASYGMYDSATFVVDLTSKEGESYAKYMDKVLNRQLLEEGVESIMFKKGELFGQINGKYQKIDGKFSLLKTTIDHNLNSSISSLAKSAAYQKGISRLDDLNKQPFLIIGGKGDWQAAGDFIDAFMHETISKPLKLIADPMEALRQSFPDYDDSVSPLLKKILNKKYMPDIGLDGQELVTDWRSMVKSHGAKLATFGTLAYFGLGTLNWGAQQVAPDGTPIGDAGLLGAGAYTIRKAHEGYARFSDITGLTALRDYVEEKAPGSDGWQSTFGLTGAGAMFGLAYGSVQDFAAEATSSEKYKEFVQSKKKTEELDGFLGKFFKSKYTKTGKAMRIGGAIGFAAALPFTLAGFGAESSADVLAAEYAGEKEVAVKKGRFWESGFTPWEGGEVDYYRPNWYAKLMDNAKDKELYGGDISPIGHAARAIFDPYWLEKRRYHEQPYPVTGPDGSMMGIFGPIYEASLGRIIKPVATMHASVLPEELINNTEYDIDALARKQWNATLEFMGLRGFAVKAVKENLTGSQEIFTDPDEARSAKDIDSVVRDFYDLQIGGGMLTTEALRRVFQSQDSFQKAQIGASINLNPLKNTMPSWLPGSEYVTDFKSGDPFMKIKDGYYRLPGAGFASRYEELEGVRPEDYQDIYKYKILADVAYGSNQFRQVKGRLQNRELTEYEQSIYDQVQAQVEEKKKSEINVRDPSTYDSFLGRYSAFVTDLARSNPLETLLPVSPAHKFLAPPDIEDYMDEQRYSKEYRSWSNPVDDFVLPAVSMTMNSLGMGGIDMNDDPMAYQDKQDFVEYSNLARQAQASGDLRAADKYTVMAQKTYTGKDLYNHHADVGASMPAQERKVFNYFVGADVVTKQKMLEKVNPRYRDAYQAQLDMQMRQEIEHSSMSRGDRRRAMKDLQARQEAIEARRKAEIQDLRSNMSEGSGASSGRKNYINNRARDYHDYKPKPSSTDNNLAQGDMPNSISKPASYTSHYSELNKAGVENALVVLRPGLDNSAKVNVKVDRRKERNEALRSWGYTK